jgi:Protein of unknown function (DUF3011)/Peptidase inhibitor family I36
MKLRVFFRVAVLVIVSAGLAKPASAQQTVKCESNNGGRNYCGSYAANQVTMSNQISGSPCIRGNTWGVDNRGLWVDKGCRAYFVINRGGGYPGGGYPPPPPPPGGGGWNHPRPGGDPWPPSGNWNGGNWGRGGACFYKDSNFRGDYICLRRGESRPALSMNDSISSIRVFGGARALFYIDSNFRGQRGTTVSDIANLSNWRVPGMNHSWNDRISSVQVQ